MTDRDDSAFKRSRYTIYWITRVPFLTPSRYIKERWEMKVEYKTKQAHKFPFEYKLCRGSREGVIWQFCECKSSRKNKVNVEVLRTVKTVFHQVLAWGLLQKYTNSEKKLVLVTHLKLLMHILLLCFHCMKNHVCLVLNKNTIHSEKERERYEHMKRSEKARWSVCPLERVFMFNWEV